MGQKGMNFYSVSHNQSCTFWIFLKGMPRGTSFIFLPKLYFSPSAIRIDAQFVAESTGDTKLILPVGMYEREKRYDGIADLRLANKDARINDNGNGNSVTIRSRPSETINISYSLRQHALQENEGFNPDFPTINDTYIHFNGSMLLHPERFSTVAAHVAINWDLPDRWKLANSFGCCGRNQKFEGNFGKTSVNNIYDSVFVAGDFRTYTLDIQSHPVVLSVRGNWKFTDKEIVDVTRKAILTHRTFWRDFDEPYYFAVLMPNEKPCCRIGGHGLTQSFAAYLSEKDESLERFTHVLAHEHFHHWNGEKIAPEAWERTYWFTEGFTEYYSWQLNMLSGLLSYEGFVDAVNAAIYKYYSSEKRLATNEEAGNGMNKDGAYTVLSYYRGMLIASEWDAEIRRKSKGAQSLRDYMLRLYEKTGKSGRLLTNEIASETLAEFLGEQAKSRFKSDVTDGKLVQPSSDALGACSHVVDQKIHKYDLGFVNGPTKIFKLKPGSNGFAAGLRNGQEILDEKFRDFVPWDPVSLQVRDQSGSRWITYYSVSDDTIDLPLYVIERQRTSPACQSWSL